MFKSIKGVLVEYGRGGHSSGHTHPKSAIIYATVLEAALAVLITDIGAKLEIAVETSDA